MSNSDHYWFIVPAAGIGSRMNADLPKQYLKLGNQSILDTTIHKLLEFPLTKGIVLVLSPEDSYWQQSDFYQSPDIVIVSGGKDRFNSVFNALEYLLKNTHNKQDWVLVHDAARPCIRHSDLNKIIDECQQHQTGGILASPVHDTIKQATNRQTIDKTLDRQIIWKALTPQMFKLEKLHQTLKKAIDNHWHVTDEASAIELDQGEIKLIEGHDDNIKITRPQDLSLAHFYLQQQELACSE
jgi:2-C-methyl-D-erythritol 4-phosphate cytidylyltransferase